VESEEARKPEDAAQRRNPVDPQKSNRHGFLTLGIMLGVLALVVTTAVVGAFATQIARGSAATKTYLSWTSAAPGFYDEKGAKIPADSSSSAETFSLTPKTDSSDNDYFAIEEIVSPINAVTLVMPRSANGIAIQSIEPVADENRNIFADSAYSSIKEIYFPSFYFKLGSFVFANMEALEEVHFSSSSEKVFILGEGAFLNDSSLTEITIPSTLRSIGDRAFEGTSGLKTIALPSTLLQIGAYAFKGSGIETIVYEGTLAQWEAIEKGKGAFPTNITITCQDGQAN